MKTKKCFCYLVLSISSYLIIGLMACGGGGGGGSSNGGGGGEGLQYIGNSDSVVITPSNATSLIASVFGAVDLSDQISSDLDSNTSQFDNQASMIGAVNSSINETESCNPSGYITIIGTINDENGTGTLTLTYHDCQNLDTFVNGSLTLRIDLAELTPDMWTPLDSTLTFNQITIIEPDLNITLGGTLRDQYNYADGESFTFNIVLKDNKTLQMQKAENLQIILAYVLANGAYVPSKKINGRLYDSELGYLDIITNQTLLYKDDYSQYPYNGQLQIKGAGGSSLRITAKSEFASLIELNLDNDLSYETTGEIPWKVIAESVNNPNDKDGDGIADSWETDFGLSSSTFSDASQDSDNDTLTNYEEYLLGIDPTKNDTDYDNIPDGWEVEFGFNPKVKADAELDTDGDGATTLQEYNWGTNPTNDTSTPADLAMSVRASLNTVSANTLYTYTLSVKNLGPGTSRGINVNNTLPGSAEIYLVPPYIQSFWPWDCSIGSGNITCSSMTGTMAAGEESAIAVLPVIAPALTGEITNSATVGSTTFDYENANDNIEVTTTIVSPILTQVDYAIDGENGVDGIDYPFRLVVSPDGKHIYVPGIYDDSVAVFARDPVDGTLSFVEVQRDGIDTPNMPDFPKEAAISPDGNNVYVTTEWSNGEWVGSVVAYSRNPDTGALTFIAKYRNGVDGIDGIAQAFAVSVSEDGENIFVTGPNSIAVFNRNTNDGLLTFSASFVNGVEGVDGLSGAFDFALSPDDEYLYVGGTYISLFSRNSSGILTYVGVITNALSTLSIEISNDGKYLYAIGQDANTNAAGVMVFARDISNGTLTHIATYFNGENGIVSLDGMYGLSISPDGRYVYVAATYGNALGVFARNQDTGVLHFVEVHKYGVNGVEGNSPWAVAVSPDNTTVYVSAHALNAFKVDLSAER